MPLMPSGEIFPYGWRGGGRGTEWEDMGCMFIKNEKKKSVLFHTFFKCQTYLKA